MPINGTNFFYESASERNNSNYDANVSSFGPAIQNVDPDDVFKPFGEHFNDLHKQYKDDLQIDIQTDIRGMLADHSFMEQYKADLMAPVIKGFKSMSPGDPHIQSIVENVSQFWDNKVRSYTESASITGFLPISTLEFPVLVKQFFSSILKDIIEVETVKTPTITKHIRTTYMVDNQTGDEYEYPKCMFDGTWEKIWDATKGHKISEEIVPLDNGRLWKYDIISGLTDGIPGVDRLSFNFKIIGISTDKSTIIRLPGNGITIEFSTNGTLVNGNLDFYHNGDHIEDTLGGQVNFKEGTITLASANDVVKGVVFEGYLSNEKNLRSASVREKRDIMKFTIEDGPRFNMPFSIEEIEDAAALLDINYYNRMVDEIVRVQEMQKCMTVIKFMNDEFAKFNGVTTDTYKLESLARTYKVNIMPPSGFAGDPFKYISTAIQFRLKALLHQIADDTKLEGLSYIIVGNPKACELISEFTQWKSQQGTAIGGINVNNSYGFSTDLGANVRVVATNLYDAYTVETVTDTNERELVLHIYGYPTDSEHISFRHLEYTSHLMTSQSQTAYQSPQAPGGAYNIVTATGRFKDIAIQGIQADLIILNSALVYGKAPSRPPVTGAPWGDPTGNPIP